MYRILKYLLLSLLIIIIAVIIYAYFSTHNKRSGTLLIAGLEGKVIITRDEHGVPHIHALKNDSDAFFALGYVHAQDRFWQMEFQRRVVAGRLSEVLGKAAVDKDKFLRTWGFYRAAQSAWPALAPSTKRFLHSYTLGVNAFLATNHLPLQFKFLHYKPEPWTDIDSFSWSKMIAFDLQNAWKQKITRYEITKRYGKTQLAVLLPSYPKVAPTVLSSTTLAKNNLLSHAAFAQPSTDIQQQINKIGITVEKIRQFLGFHDHERGSNTWVIAGRFTNTGKPLLANDPHLDFAAPSLWYLVDLKGPHLHVIGATVPGYPGIVIGHNDHIAWGVTNVDPDTQDLYIESPRGPFKILHEKIKVKGDSDIDWIVKISPHGPIISPVTAAAEISPLVALKWTALFPNDTTLQSIFKINYAKNWHDFTEALRDFVAPSQNFVYADREGNIGYYLPGLIPIRNSYQEWVSYIPFDKLPHAYNPSEGWIASTNNKIVPDEYPYHLTLRWKEPPYRAQRLADLLAGKKLFSLQACQKMQMDTVNYLWRDLKPFLITTVPLDEPSQKALYFLKNWDGESNLESQAATVFNFWYRELTHMLNPSSSENYWKEPLFIYQQIKNNGPYCRSHYHHCGNYLSHTLQQAMDALIKQRGQNPRHWKWGDIHHALFIERAVGSAKSIGWIWNRSISTPGDSYTLNVGTYDFPTFNHINGASYRQIIDLSNWNNSQFIYPLGQVDNPFDKHFSDLLPLWRNGKYITITNDPKTWGATQQLILEPNKGR